MVTGPLSILPSTKVKRYNPSTRRDLRQPNELFTTRSEQNIDDGLPLYLFILQR